MDKLEEMLERMKKDSTKNLLEPDMNRNAENSPLENSCPICGGMEFILTEDEEGREIAVPCKCREKNIAGRRLSFAELPENFKRKTLKDFRMSVYQKPESRQKISVAVQMIKWYLGNFERMQEEGKGLYLFSNAKGSGKTTLIAGIANELLKGHNVKFSTSLRILNEIKATWGKNGSEESRLLDAIITCEILIIDDFGTEKSADWINDKFYHIINERYVGRRVTLFTSNHGLKELDYDERITSRIRECTYQISFPEESVREVIAQENERKMERELMA